MELLLKIVPLVIVLNPLFVSGLNHEMAQTGTGICPAGQTIADTSRYGNKISVGSFDLEIIPPSSGVKFFKDGIVFLSSSKEEVKMLPGHLSFGKSASFFAPLQDSVLGQHVAFSNSVPIIFPNEAVSFSNDFQTMYFTKKMTAGGKEKIFSATYITDSKGNPGWAMENNPLEFCEDNFNYSHPAFSSDGKMLIFSSDMKGSMGGMDLFLTRNAGNKWSVPQNLGSVINTKGNELFAFLDRDNNLYFSTDGMKGYGGYDIYSCRFNGKTWDKPVILTVPVNTKYDDIAFSIDNSYGRRAFYSVRKKSGKDPVQLCMVKINDESDPGTLLTLSQLFTVPGSAAGLPVTTTASAVMEPEKKLPVKVETEKNIVPEKTEIEIKPAETATKQINELPVKENSQKDQTVKPDIKQNLPQGDVVIYRIQFISNNTPKGSFKVTINNKVYNTFEYKYGGSYRSTVGEFDNLRDAIEFQNICRKSGLNQSFVVAFRNNVRTLDPSLFK